MGSVAPYVASGKLMRLIAECPSDAVQLTHSLGAAARILTKNFRPFPWSRNQRPSTLPVTVRRGLLAPPSRVAGSLNSHKCPSTMGDRNGRGRPCPIPQGV